MKIKYLLSFLLFNAKCKPFQVVYDCYGSLALTMSMNKNSDEENKFLSRYPQLNRFFLQINLSILGKRMIDVEINHIQLLSNLSRFVDLFFFLKN